jgi:hypothetical protein
MARNHGSHTLNRNVPASRDRLWLTIRILRKFTLPQMCATAEVPYDNARRYIVQLERTGFLRLVQDHISGKAGSFKVYALVRDSGPLAPLMRNDGTVYDRNSLTVFPEGCPLLEAL